MTTLLRHMLSILLLPFMVVGVAPAWLRAAFAASDTGWVSGSVEAVIGGLAGGALFMAGLGLFGWCVALFARVGRGTLAPWDPTRDVVAVGPYRYVRNPMISGVALMLAGEAAFWGSMLVALWAGAFVLINHIYFVLSEEPGLERRFGEAYRVYKASVPRWLPRHRPWQGGVR
jgi:protein-S-isoprenylcysteine O-methyltransferase Ste14